MIIAARIIYAHYWKQEEVPDIWDWTQKMLHKNEMEKLTITLKDQEADGFYNDWGKFKEYFGGNWDLKGQLILLEDF